jgi:hypothetical protein
MILLYAIGACDIVHYFRKSLYSVGRVTLTLRRLCFTKSLHSVFCVKNVRWVLCEFVYKAWNFALLSPDPVYWHEQSSERVAAMGEWAGIVVGWVREQAVVVGSQWSRRWLEVRECVCVRGHPSIPLLPLALTMSICIPHSLYTYPTTPRPLRPSCDHRHSSSISRYSTIRPTSSQPRLMPHNYHHPHQDGVTWPYDTLWWSSDFHIWKAWY